MRGQPRRAAVRRVVAGVIGLLGAGFAIGFVPSAVATASPDAPLADPAPVIVIGVSDLRWTDIDPKVTPTLWRLVGDSAVGSVSVRTVRPVTCPIDGWLSLSAGSEATSTEVEGDRGTLNPGQVESGELPTCGLLPDVGAQAGSYKIAGWQDFVRLQEETKGAYGTLGTLGDLLSRAGVCSTPIGPGAAIALAGLNGEGSGFESAVTADSLRACPVTIVDAGSTNESSVLRPSSLSEFDSLVSDVVTSAPPGSHVLISGVADPTASPPPLQVAMEHVVGLRRAAWLSSSSTRHEGLVQLTDIVPTVLELADAPYEQFDAKPWESETVRRLSVTDTVEDRQDFDQIAEVIPDEGPVFGAWIAAVPISILFASLIALIAKRQGVRWAQHPLFNRIGIGAALFVGAVPTALYLVTAVHWWRWDHPALVLGTVTVIAAVAIAFASAVARIPYPWRFVTVQCAITYVALTFDGLNGTKLQLGSPLAAGQVYGGRFYGFGNVTFTVYATATLLIAAAVAQILLRRGRQDLAVMATILIGGLAILVDGWPTFGADFGGILALVPGVVLLVLLTAGVAMTWQRITVVGVTGVVAVAVVSWLDYLRPADSRSHMGAFVARVIDGEAGKVLENKVDALVTSLTTPLGWLEIIGFAVAVAIVFRPDAFRLPELARVFEEWPVLRHALLALAVTFGLGTLVNDSGALIAGLGVLTTAPLMIATCAWWAVRTEPATQPPATTRA
ncbi:MAG TPA: hypothetical protein VKB55_21585 [Nocardioidaceae bacterium]|nr:hypothetical protein [Nocardioidaceae bacterium]